MPTNKDKKVFNLFKESLIFNIKKIEEKKINKVCKIIKSINKKNKILIFGNGAGQSIANHFAVDLTKNCKINALTFSEGNHITCYANDYGYENWVVRTIQNNYKKNDLIILLSASGNSPNIVNAAKFCKKKNIKFITLSGFKSDNKISKLGTINLWFNSKSFNIVEMLFSYVLLLIVDLIKGTIFYSNKK